jgi:iron complex transport system substrate-binding protein
VTRASIYFVCIAAIVLTAVALRVFNPSARVTLAPTTQSVDTAPRDFVVSPWVAPGEESKGPARIISLAPSITESVCALGLRGRLVGRTQYCTWPPAVQPVPIVGALTDTNLELIKALRPDVVLVTWNSFEPIRKMQAIGLHVEQIPHESLEEVYTGIVRLGDLCGRPTTARALIGSIWADIDRLQRHAAARPHTGTRVLMTLDMKVPPQALYVAGKGTFLDTMLHLAGYSNAADAAITSKYGELPLEKLREVNPDCILDFGPPRTPTQDAELYAAWSQVAGLKAIQERKVIAIGGPQWLSAGPRIAIELHRFITLLEKADTK